MRKSILIASLAVISINVLGMNPLDNNNLAGNNPGHMLTPDSSSHKNSTNNEDNMQYLALVVQQCISGELTQKQRNSLVRHMYQQIFEQKQIIKSKNEESKVLSEKIFQFTSDVNKKDNEINNLYMRLNTLNTEKLDLENQVRQYQKIYPNLKSSMPSWKPSSTFQPSNTEYNLNLLAETVLSSEWTAKSNQSKSDSTKRSDASKEENINQNISIESEKDSTTSVNLDNDSDIEQVIVLQAEKIYPNSFVEDNTVEQVRFSAKRPAPEEISVSQRLVQRLRTNREEATSLTSNLQQQDNILNFSQFSK